MAKKRSVRVLAIILALLMIVSLLPISLLTAFAEEETPEVNNPEGNEEPLEEAVDPESDNPIDNSKNGISLNFWKGDKAEDSLYVISAEDVLFDSVTDLPVLDSEKADNPNGSYALNAGIPGSKEEAFSLELSKEYAEAALKYRFVRESDKSFGLLFPAAVQEQVGFFDIDGAFGAKLFEMYQDNDHIATYVLFFVKEDGTDMMKYTFGELNASMTAYDLFCLLDQYGTGSSSFVECNDINGNAVSAEALEVMRDIFRTDFTALASGIFPVEEIFDNVSIDLSGPQKQSIPSDVNQETNDDNDVLLHVKPVNDENQADDQNADLQQDQNENQDSNNQNQDPDNQKEDQKDADQNSDDKQEIVEENQNSDNDQEIKNDDQNDDQNNDQQNDDTDKNADDENLENNNDKNIEDNNEKPVDESSDKSDEKSDEIVPENDKKDSENGQDQQPSQADQKQEEKQDDKQEEKQEDNVDKKEDENNKQEQQSKDDLIDNTEDLENKDTILNESKDEPLLQDNQLTDETITLARGLRSAPLALGNSNGTDDGNNLRGDQDGQDDTQGQDGSEVENNPASADGITITRLKAHWLSSSTGEDKPAGTDPLVLVPNGTKMPNQQWQINMSLTGNGNLEPGTIELVIPAYIWKDRDGNEPGLLTLAIPEEGQTSSNNFAYKRVGDNIVITNVNTMSADSAIMIQGTFRMTYPDPSVDENKVFSTTYSYNMVDIDVADPTQHENNGISNDFYAVANVITPMTNTVITETSNAIYATVNTSIVARGAYVSNTDNGKVYVNEIPETMPEEFLPSNPNDYVYVKWYLDGAAQGNQPYIMKSVMGLVNTGSMLVDGEKESQEIELHPQILGTVYSGQNIKAENPERIETELYRGYAQGARSVYVWIAYPKSDFSEGGAQYTVKNQHTVYVTGMDDEIETSVTSGFATASFRLPVTWKIDVVWVDDNNIRGKRPENVGVSIYHYDKIRDRIVNDASGIVNEGNLWHFEWTDLGLPTSYSAEQGGLPSGTTDYKSYSDGHSTYWRWGYYTKRSYDKDTHTWTFTNTYYENAYSTARSTWSSSKGASNHYDYRLKSTGDHDLTLLNNKQQTSIITYSLNSYGWILPDTIAQNGSIEDPSTYNQRYVTFELEDRDVKFGTIPLSEEDYQVVYITASNPEVASWVRDEDEDDPKIGHSVAAETVPVDFYGFKDSQWVKLATYYKGSYTEMLDGTSVSGSKLYLPEGIYYTKAAARTNQASLSISYGVAIRLLPSSTVTAEVERLFEADDFIIQTVNNNALMRICDSDGNAIRSSRDYGTAYLHGRNSRLQPILSKYSRYIKNDRDKKNLVVANTITLSQYTNIVEKNDLDDARRMGILSESVSGTFYDLLPPGMVAQLDTVKSSTGTITNKYIIENYKESGSQLLVVKIRLKNDPVYDMYSPTWSDGYWFTDSISFNMTYSYDEVQNRGTRNLKNYAAYEADEAKFGNKRNYTGEPDDPTVGNHSSSSSIPANIVPFMTNLDPNRNDPNFVYIGTRVEFTEIDSYAETTIDKRVKTTDMDYYKIGQNNDVNVYEGGTYSYKLQVTSGYETNTTGIIMMDKFESYIPEAEDPDYNPDGCWSWKGKFLSVDVSEIEASGVKPIIYYSTNPNLDLDNYNNGNEDDVVKAKLQTDDWTTEVPDDLSTITAIAIDCSTDKDGNPFALQSEKALIAYVYMKAPTYEDDNTIFSDTDYENFENNAHAFNSAHLDFHQADYLGYHKHVYKRFVYTKVGIIAKDLHVKKEWDDFDDNDRIRPEEVTVTLMQNGVDTGRTLTLKASENWEGVFEHIVYYDESAAKYSYTVKEDSVPDYTSTSQIEDDQITIINSHKLYETDVPFKKIWRSDEPEGWEENIPSSLGVRLYGDGEFTGRVLNLRGTGTEWEGEFIGVQKFKDGVPIEYTVEEVPVPIFYLEQEGNVLTNVYYPYGDMSVKKVVVNATEAALDNYFTFILELKNKNDNTLPDTGQYEYTIFDENDNPVETGMISNGNEFLLKNEWRILIKDLPASTEYVVTENDRPGFSLLASSQATGKIIAFDEKQVVFTNRYATSGSIMIAGTKDLVGREMKTYQFKFSLFNSAGSAIRSASNSGEGKLQFGAIRYTGKDDGKQFVYKVAEVNAGKPGYTYDPSVYYVEIIPRDTGRGSMTIDAKYYTEEEFENAMANSAKCETCNGSGVVTADEGTEATCGQCNGLGVAHVNFSGGTSENIIAFHNIYHAEGDISLHAWKVLKQRDLTADEFTFQIFDEDGNFLGDTKNDAEGNIAFDPLHFDEEDVGKEFLYTVMEQTPSRDQSMTEDPTVIYDETEFIYKIQPSDKGDGTLSFSQEMIDPASESSESTAKLFDSFTIKFEDGNISMTGSGEWKRGDAGAAEEGSITIGSGSAIIFTKNENNHIDLDIQLPVLDDLYGASVLITLGDYKGKFTLPTQEEVSNNTVFDYSDKVLMTYSVLPVFINSLKDGSLTVTKNVQNAESANPNQEFHFKLKFVGQDVSDEDIEFYIVDDRAAEFVTASADIEITDEQKVSMSDFTDCDPDDRLSYANAMTYAEIRLNIEGKEIVMKNVQMKDFFAGLDQQLVMKILGNIPFESSSDYSLQVVAKHGEPATEVSVMVESASGGTAKLQFSNLPVLV